MEQKVDKGPRFTGGDHLTGFPKLVHAFMMKNELKNGYGGYKASFAGGNSGISFGGNQMDMGKHSGHAAIFSEILENATNASGQKIFTQSEVETIVGKDNLKLQVKGQTAEQVFGKNLARVNEALSSPYGMKVINEAYSLEIASVINTIDSIVQDIKNPAAKQFYSTDFGRAVLCDYSNAFDLKRNGKFIVEYIDGFYTGLTRNIYPSKTDKIEAPRDVYTNGTEIDKIKPKYN